MAAKPSIILSGDISNMGFRFLTKDTDKIDIDTLVTNITAMLDAFKTANLCDYSTKDVDLSGIGDEGKRWSVTTANKRIGKNLWAAVKCLDDESLLN